MRNVWELVGSLTQARVQMMAAKAVIQKAVDDMSADKITEMTALTGGVLDPKNVPEAHALARDAKTLERCMSEVKDIRERYTSSDEPGASCSGS